MVLSGIFRCLSSILGTKRPSESAERTEQLSEDVHRPNKVMRLNIDQSTALKMELESIQASMTTQIQSLGEKFKAAEEQKKDWEAENRNLKELLCEESLEVRAEKKRNEALICLLKETEEKMAESMRQTAQLLEVTRVQLGKVTKTVDKTDFGASSVEPTASFSVLAAVEPSRKTTSENTISDTATAAATAENTLTSANIEIESEKPSLDSNPVPTEPDNLGVPETASSEVEDEPTTSQSSTTVPDSKPVETTSDSKETEESTATVPPPTPAPEPKGLEPIDENLRLSSLTGLDEQVKFVRENILFPLANQESLALKGLKLMKGTVFHGPSTAAQESIANALTAELSRLTGETFSFFHRKKTDVFRKYSSDAADFMKTLFESAVSKSRSVVMIEGIDTLIKSCSVLGGYPGYEDVLAEIGRQLDSIEAGRIFVIVTATEASSVPPVLVRRGRLEKSLAFETPSDTYRLGILRDQTKHWKKQPSDATLEEIAGKASALSLDELTDLCQGAYLAAFQRQFPSVCKAETLKLNSEAEDSVEVTTEDLISSLKSLKKPEQAEATDLGSRANASEKQKVEGEVIDPKLSFASVGGLDEQMKEIRENVLFPLSNKTALEQWGVEPVKGIIFHGPPGTGKTLLAKALAAELSRLTDTPYTFFHKKGTDSIQKYIGWTEAHLKELFEKVNASKPAIIFFDEIDGLCAERQDESGSSRFYNGVVTNMLGHLDSIERGEVLVIAATNRLDSLDPALIRPGRFDKTIAFFNPKEEGRKSILKIHTAQWRRGRDEKHFDEVAKQTEGFSGADLEQLCRQTFLCAIRRTFPNLGADKVDSSEFENFDVLLEDWYTALKTIKPNNTDSVSTTGKAFSPGLSKLISGIQSELLVKISPILAEQASGSEKGSGIKSFLISESESEASESRSMLHSFIIPSLIGSPELKETRTFTLGEGTLDISSMKTLMGQVLRCQQRAILYIPRIDKIQDKFAEGDKTTPRMFMEQLESLRGENVLLLASSSCLASELPEELRPIFKCISGLRSYKVRQLLKSEVREFFVPILEEKFPVLLNRVENLTEKSNIYDILDLKAEISQVFSSSREEELPLALKNILDNYAGNQLNCRAQRNNMYS